MKYEKYTSIPDNVNWEYLKRFMICVESSNFNEACNKIGTSGGALQKQLDALEESLNIYLFEVTNRNRTINITPEGLSLYNLVKDVGAHLKGIAKIPKSEEFLKPHELNIITTPGLASTVLAPIVSKYHNKYPEVLINLNTETIPRKINPTEIMIRSDFKFQNEVKRILLFRVKMNLYASKEYVKKFGKPKDLEELGNHKNLILGNVSYGNTNWAIAHIGKFHKSSSITSNSINFLYEMCKFGHGLLELPNVFSHIDELEKIFENKDTPEMEIYLSYHLGAENDINISNFINLIKEDLNNFS